ncbi:MAG TPA: hypothetical protein VFJ43_11050 [Bacteroidia bacterium]|nr:hypothetical protein [Bacteroidia bacterium]
MKRFLVFLLISLPLLSFTDSRSWLFVNPNAVPDTTPYATALAQSDLDKYRYFDKRNTLHFDNGLDVELLSANELTAAGIPFNKDHVRTEVPSFDTHPVFKLTTTGILVEVQTRSKIK